MTSKEQVKKILEAREYIIGSTKSEVNLDKFVSSWAIVLSDIFRISMELEDPSKGLSLLIEASTMFWVSIESLNQRKICNAREFRIKIEKEIEDNNEWKQAKMGLLFAVKFLPVLNMFNEMKELFRMDSPSNTIN